MGKHDDLEQERQKRIDLEAELAALKDKKPLNYHEPFPGFRIKRWFVIAAVDAVIFWYVLLNVELTETQGWLFFIACASGPAIWMAWMNRLTGINYFDD